MRQTSKTGLLPTVKKSDKIDIRVTAELEMPKIVVPAPFTLKPFAGIYNPFSYACSILCNHPAGFDAKSVIKKAKLAWSLEGKSVVDLDEFSLFRAPERTDSECRSLLLNEERDDNVPEELFRKYTETDSRPITPTPTLASIITKNLSRRCMTPDPTSFKPAREKTLLVLDLRRSHSQETICWPANRATDVNFETNLRQEALSRTTSNLCANPLQARKKKSDRKKPAPSSARTSSLKTQTSRDSESKVQTQHSPSSQSHSKNSAIQELQAPEVHEVSSEGSFDGANVIKRRGKKTKKGKKTGKEGTKGEREFQGIPDPGETQVSALENESKEGSSRPSSSEESFLKNQVEGTTTNRESKPEEEKNISFLSLDILKRLQRQLDQDVVDSELNAKVGLSLISTVRWLLSPIPSENSLLTLESLICMFKQMMLSFMHILILIGKSLSRFSSLRAAKSHPAQTFQRKIALEEALRLKMTPKQIQQGEEMRNLQKEFQLVIKDSEKWLSIPRVFTRRSARFELPMDSRILNDMTPMQYAGKYVFASIERLVLYNHVFNLYKEEPEDDEDKERILLGKNVMEAVGKVMGRPLTAEEAKEFRSLIKWEDKDCIDFRTFAGISATCERVMSPRFCSKMLSQKEDPRPEIERADFETLDQKLIRLNPDRTLVQMLKSIRDT